MCRLECGAGYVIEASLSLHTSKWDRAIVNTAMLSVQRWKCNKLCGFSPLQTQFPTCLFARVSIQHDKLEEHSSSRSLGDGLVGLLHRAPEGGKKKKCMLVIWVLSATAAKHRPVLTEGCLVSGSALCPAVCLSLSKCVQGAEHHASTEWLTNPRHPKTPMWAWFRLEGQISASELVYCSPDEPKVHEIVALSHFFFFLYLFPSGHIRCFQFEAGCSGINSGCASCCRVAAGRQHHSNTCGCHLNLLSSITMFSFLKPLQ